MKNLRGIQEREKFFAKVKEYFMKMALELSLRRNERTFQELHVT